METWLSYSLHDLLIFSPASYFRLFELSNQALWPWHILLLGLAIVAAYYALSARYPRLTLIWLAAVWAFVGYWFLLRYYSQINTLADVLAYGFFTQAGLLVLGAALIRPGEVSRWQRTAGIILLAYGYLLHPCTLWLWSRAASGVEVFSVAPDPTAVATLGFALLLPLRWKPVFMIIPLLWISFSILTYVAF